MARRGLVKCDDQFIKVVCDAIRLGNYRDVAAEWAGVDGATFSRWINRDRGPMKDKLRREVVRAERKVEVRCVGLIIGAAMNHPQHAKWFLERKFPERWGRKDKLLVSVPGGDDESDRQEIDVSKLDDAELAQLEALLVKASLGAGDVIDVRPLPALPPVVILDETPVEGPTNGSGKAKNNGDGS